MIVIPAAGKGSRFKAQGILTPKFMLPLYGRTVFDFVLQSFADYYAHEDFVIVAADRREDRAFFESTMNVHGVQSYDIIPADALPGMIPAVHHALTHTRFTLDQPLLIHVADVYRHHFDMPRPNTNTLTADFVPVATRMPKEPLGPWETLLWGKGAGCYHISRAEDFVRAYEPSRAKMIHQIFGEKAMEAAEGLGTVLRLRAQGYALAPRMIPLHHVVDCGTPELYRAIRRTEFHR